MKRLIYFSLLLFILISCKNNSVDPLAEENKKLPINEKIKLSLTPDYIDSIGIHDENVTFLNSLYSSRNYQPFWINDSCLTKEGELLEDLIKNTLQFSIPDQRYAHFNWEKANYLQKELMITSKLALLSEDLCKGIFEKDTLAIRASTFPEIVKFLPRLNFRSSNKNEISHQIINWGPKDSNYLKLAISLYDFCQLGIIDTTTFDVPTLKSDTINSQINMKAALVSKGFLKNEIVDSNEISNALKSFQIQNGLESDGKVGLFTRKALNESTYNKILRTILTLDKWRKKNDYPTKNIRINIPEYMLYLTLDSIQEQHRIIIGKTETRTPELQATINRFVLFPYWTVPQSIKNKEMLEAAQNNVAYFKRNNLKVFKNEVEIDPTTINWHKYKNSFPFKVRQEFGPKNSLGIIKYEFNNPYGVYLHDTPSKGLFSKDIRAFSHGCMRCQDPIELAKTILMNDCKKENCNKIDTLDLDSLILLGQNHSVHLINPIQINVEYKSVIVKEKKLIFLIDIYDKDEKYIQLLKRKTLHN
jgi:murein L,D-transpeptidase YcbB/YkuD